MTRNPADKDGVQRIFSASRFTKHLGIKLNEIKEGQLSTVADVKDEWLQQDGFVHGGFIATIADHTAGAVASTFLVNGAKPLTIEFKINFLRPARGKRLTCVATVLKNSRTLIVAESSVYAVQRQRLSLVAKAIVTLAVLNRA